MNRQGTVTQENHFSHFDLAIALGIQSCEQQTISTLTGLTNNKAISLLPPSYNGACFILSESGDVVAITATPSEAYNIAKHALTLELFSSIEIQPAAGRENSTITYSEWKEMNAIVVH